MVRKWAREGHSPIALVGQTKADVRDTMVEIGDSGILNVSPPDFKPSYEPSKRRLTWPNGVQAIIYSGDEPDQLRGPQHCFVAGTLIATPHGERSIETIKNGDYVLTRQGKRKVIETFCRYDEVGKVKFSNGAELVATAQHPVLQLDGWTRISTLTQGEMICTGERLLTDTSQFISAGKRSTNIDGFGNNITGLSQKVLKFITGIKINSTTILATWFSRQSRHIVACMTRLGKELWLSAEIVGQTLRGLEITPVPQFAGVANLNEQRNGGNLIGYAKSAEIPINHGSETPTKETSVASVVSTWEHVGRARVYNITVEDQPEYIANGIIVHNCKAWVDELAKFMYPQATWDNLMLGLRIGDKPQVVVTTTPRPLKIIKDLVKDSRTVVTRGHTLDNELNLAPEFLKYILRKYEGTKLGRQELAGEILDTMEGLVYDSFKPDVCVIPRRAIPDDWPRYWGCDFGPINTAALWYALEPATGFLYLYRTYKKRASVQEHAANWKELSEGEFIQRKVGGSHLEQEIRDGYGLAGWHILEPTRERKPEAQRLSVYGINARNREYVFSDLQGYIDEKTSFSWEVDKEDNLTQKIHNESQYHFMAAARYILSDLTPEIILSQKPQEPVDDM